MTKNKIWIYTYALLCFFLSIKLIFSFSVLEDVNQNNESSISVFYYASDIAILLLITINQLMLLSMNKDHDYNRLTNIRVILTFMLIFGVTSSMISGKAFFQSFSSQLKIILPFFILITLIQAPPKKLIPRKLLLLPVIILILSVYALIYFPASKNRLEYFWPVYFSGLHTQAYVVLCSFFIVYFYLNLLNYGIFIRFLLLAVVFYALTFGYNVRTSMVCWLIFLFYFYLNKYLSNKKIKFLTYNLILLTLLSCAVIFNTILQDFDFDFFSSGRLSVYASRINYIFNRGIFENLFGSGAGSDLMFSTTWWWEEKGSHNDYLTLFIEYGFIYLALFLFILYKLFSFFKGNTFLIGLLLVYFSSSLISNGLMFRPLPSYLFFLFAALIHISLKQSEVVFKQGKYMEAIDI